MEICVDECLWCCVVCSVSVFILCLIPENDVKSLVGEEEHALFLQRGLHGFCPRRVIDFLTRGFGGMGLCSMISGGGKWSPPLMVWGWVDTLVVGVGFASGKEARLYIFR